jgi:hypothetical protein
LHTFYVRGCCHENILPAEKQSEMGHWPGGIHRSPVCCTKGALAAFSKANHHASDDHPCSYDFENTKASGHIDMAALVPIDIFLEDNLSDQLRQMT